MEHCLDGVQATCCNLAIAIDDEDSAHNGHSEQRNEADGGGNAEIQSGNVQSQNAAADCKRNSQQSHDAITERVKQAVEKHHDQGESDGKDERKPVLCLLQGFEFPGPFDAITGWQL